MDKLKRLSTPLNRVKNWFLVVALALALALALGIGWVLLSRFLGTTKAQPQYQTAKVERGSIISTVSESGSVLGSQSNVTSPTNGIVEEVYVKNGDGVTAGQNLFKVRSTATPQEKAASYATYLAAQNTLKSAQAKINSLQSALFKANQAFLNDKGVPNPDAVAKTDPKYVQENADWLQAEADYKNQAGVIAQAQAALNSAALSYQATQDMTVTAPILGTVGNLSATPGSSVTTGAVLLIGNFSNLQVKIQASEVDVPKIKSGQKTTITLDAFPDKTFVGTVENVDTIGTTTSGVVTYNVYIIFVAPPADIRPGMTASVIIQADRRDNVLKLPSSAVQTTTGENTVQTLKGGKTTPVTVEVGLSSDSETEIVSGLTEGDTIVTNSLTSTRGQGQQTGGSPFSAFGGRGFGGGGRGR